MAKLILLGTGAALSDPQRTTTMLAFSENQNTVVVDCGGDVVQRLLSAQIDLASIQHLIITHEHPDHCGGFPLFLEKLWLFGRRHPLDVYAPEATIAFLKRAFDAFELFTWTGMPEIRYHTIDLHEGAPVLEDASWHITASRTNHPPPTVGIRVSSKSSGKVVVYSCDTSPSDAITRLANQADIYVHEATEFEKDLPNVHSCVASAAKSAAEAHAKRLLLVHLPPKMTQQFVDEQAHPHFPNTELGEELGMYEF